MKKATILFRVRQAGRLLLWLASAMTFHAPAAEDLTELSLEQLMQVTVVSASKYEQKQNEVAAAVSVITRDEIRTFGWRTLAEALASLPGVYITYDRQYTYLGTRGFGIPGDLNTRVLLTINGNRINDVVFDAALLGREMPLDMDMIERIEFVPGPGGAVYGQNAMFGVVNIVTRKGANVDGAELAAAWQGPQDIRRGRASWGKMLDNGVDVLLSVSGMNASGEDLFFDYPGAGPGGTDVSGVARGMDGERDAEVFARVARGPWSFGLVYGNRRKYDPTASFFATPLVPGQNVRDRNLHTQVQYEDNLADDTLHVSGRLFLGAQDFTGRYIYDTPFLSTGSSRWYGAEMRLLSTAWARHKVMLGIEFQNSSRVNQSFEDLLQPANNIFITDDGYRAGVYVQDEWRVAEALTATLGIRLDRNDVTGTKLSPRAALIWQAMPRTTIKVLYGRAHRAPNAFERIFDDGVSQVANPALEGETIDTLECAVVHRLARDFTLRGSIYRWTMRDIVTLGIDPVSGLSQYQSGDKVNATGLELSADKTWNWGGRLRSSVSYEDASVAHGDGLPNSPQWLGRLNFSAPLPWARVRAGYELQYDSRRKAIDGTYLDGYWLSNLRLTAATWAKGLDVSFSVYNIFDKRYRQPVADTNWQKSLEQDGRAVSVGLDYRF
jgi:outer membrane receptor protein involved in Fe transport